MAADTLCVIRCRLAVGRTGGSYAKLCINPFREPSFAAAAGADDDLEKRRQPVAHGVAARTRASAVRI